MSKVLRSPPPVIWSGEPRRRRHAALLGTLLLVAQFLPYAAQSLRVFASPTPGMAHVPLPFGMGGQGFGELEAAINLASGGVYADLSGVSLNNPANTTTNATTQVRAPQITTTATQRLSGFLSEDAVEEIENPDLSTSQWNGYFAKPEIMPVYHLKNQDVGCGVGANGLIHRQRMDAGHYRLSFDGRTDAGSFPVTFGVDDTHGAGVTLTTTWQTFSGEFDITDQQEAQAGQPDRGRMFQVLESNWGNADWEVTDFKVQKLVNGVWSDNLFVQRGEQDWTGYCGEPVVNPFYRLKSRDNTYGDVASSSGVIYIGTPKTPGRYTVSFQARTRNGQLPFWYGVDDHNRGANAVLTEQWQTFTQTLTVENENGYYDRDRILQIVETQMFNPDWEIRNVSVKSNRSLPSMTPNTAMETEQWVGYFAKPAVSPVYHVFNQDTGLCGNGTNGLLFRQALPPGKYRLSFDGRVESGVLTTTFGPDDNTAIRADLTPNWTTFTADYVVGEQQEAQNTGRSFEIRESTTGNADWEVTSLRIQRQLENGQWTGNLNTNPEPEGYCASPRYSKSFRLEPQDSPSAPGYSGLVYAGEKRQPGTYMVSLRARVKGGNLNVAYGLDDQFMKTATLTPEWQTLRATFTVNAADIRSYHIERSFQIFENTPGNAPWEVKDVAVEPIVDTLTLVSGDGSSQTYQRVVPDFAKAPSWVQRAQNDPEARVYKVATRPGTTAGDAWAVTRTVNGTRIAHVFDPSGTRTTFAGDGEYADFTQNLHEQLASAKAGDPDGLSPSSPKTEFSYQNVALGQLSGVRDRWGRTTTYTWDTANGVLTAVKYLVDGGKAAQSIGYTYGSFSGRRVITEVTFSTHDGQGSPVQRTFKLGYTVGANNAILLNNVVRPVLGDKFQENIYRYTPENRVESVKTTGEQEIRFQYGTATNTPGGTRVTQTQGNRVTVYEFTPQGWLRHLSVRANGQDLTGSVWNGENTSYAYDAFGHVIATRLPSGAQVRSTYDVKGNLETEQRYLGGATTSDAWDTVAASGLQSTVTYSYDLDHQPRTSIRHVEGLPDDVKTTFTPTYDEYDSGRFKALKALTTEVTAGGLNGSRSADEYDDQGRLTFHREQDGAGKDTRVTQYLYPAAAASTTVPFPSVLGTKGTEVTVRTYADQPTKVNDAGRVTEFSYDALGNVALKTETGAYVSAWDGETASTETRTTRFAYDGFGNLVWTWVQGGGKTLGRTYSHFKTTGELEYTLEGEGNKQNLTRFTYGTDAAKPEYRRPTKVEGGSVKDAALDVVHSKVEYSYDSAGRVTDETQGGKFTTKTEYDALDRPTKVTLPNGAVIKTTYDLSGEVATEERTEGALVAVTTTTRDTLGRVTQIKFPNGKTVETTVDGNDQPSKVLDNRLDMVAEGDGRATFLTYDALGRLTKRLGPVLSSATGQAYTDARRPLSLYAYDTRGRQTQATTLLFGTVSGTSDPVLPGGAQTAVVSTPEYDAFDRPTKVIDALGYATTTEYDASDHPVKVTRQIFKGGEEGRPGGEPNDAITRTAYDGLGRPTAVTDPRNTAWKRKTFYDVFGNVTHTVNERGIVDHIYHYTSDGLLETTWEPKVDGTNASEGNTKIDQAALTHFPTEKRVYAVGSPYPTQIDRSIMSGQLSAATTYEYDHAGRPTKETLPYTDLGSYMVPARTITHTYNNDGKVLKLKSPEEFVTTNTYDVSGNLTRVEQPRRDGNTTDGAAFPHVNALVSAYEYDGTGNLTRKTENGLVTLYQYNSLGKVISESRPNVLGQNTTPKLRTYRLDGLVTAETSYDYAGETSMSGKVDVAQIGVNPGDPPRFRIDAGNLTFREYNARGDLWSEWSLKAGSVPEHQQWFRVNGLGQRYWRISFGHTGIYAEQRDASGNKLGHANTLTYWTYDANGNLTQKWDTPTRGSEWVALNATDRRNEFTYTYSPTSKELTQERTAISKTYKDWSLSVLSPQHLAATSGKTTSTYTNRDELLQVVVSETAPISPDGQNVTVSSTTDSTYYPDGRLQDVTVKNTSTATSFQSIAPGYRKLTYDQRGRVITVDQNGNKVSTFYESGGQQTETVTNSAGTPLYSKITVPTLGGQVYKTTTRKGVYPEDVESISTATFTNSGSLTNVPFSVVTTNKTKSNQVDNGSTTISYTYDVFGNLKNERRDGNTPGSSGFVASPDTGDYPRDYNSGGYLKTETKYQDSSKTRVTASYILDSRGNRLREDGSGEYSGFDKRYNTDGLVTIFNRSNSGSDTRPEVHCWGVRDSKDCSSEDVPIVYSNTQYNQFLYDPYGNLVANTSLRLYQQQDVGGANTRANWARQFNNAVFVNGEVQLMVQGNDARNDYGTRILTVKLRDQSYSLMQGYTDETKWSGLQYFSVKGSTRGIPLEAPVKPVSATVRVDPVSILPPNTTPNVPSVGSVQAPVTPPAKTTTSGASTDDKALAPLPKLTTTARENKTEAAPAKEFKLEAPSSVLPSTLSTVDVKSVTVPNSTVQAPQVPSTPVEQVTRPGAGTKEQSDGAPPTAPEGSLPFEDPGAGVSVLGTEEPITPQEKKELLAAQKTSQAFLNNLIGQAKKGDANAQAAVDFIRAAQGKYQLAGLVYAVKIVEGIDFVSGELGSAGNKLDNVLTGMMRDAVEQGDLTLGQLRELGRASDRMRLSQSKGDDAMFVGALFVNVFGAATTSAIADMLPVIGDVKGFFEGIVGQDIFTGDRLAAWERGLGIAGLVGAGLVTKFVKGGKTAKAFAPIIETLTRYAGGWLGRTCRVPNSFSPDTPVRTLSGLVAISTLTIGTSVLAFNEQTGENGYYPITAVISHGTKDQGVTYLSLSDPEQDGKLEYIQTTPEHPFYVKEWSDAGERPKPVGHEDLNEHWVGAGHLKVGDKIKQADGTTGVVANVVTLQQTREMFNLTVSEAHTYYVGNDGWLVHNCDFVADAKGVAVPTSQSRYKQILDNAGLPSKPTQSPGTEYILPDGSRVRLMEPSGPAGRRASFENANGQPVDAFTGKTPQPPRGLTPAQRRDYVRSRTHVEQNK